jgi:hypothetical protein
MRTNPPKVGLAAFSQDLHASVLNSPQSEINIRNDVIFTELLVAQSRLDALPVEPLPRFVPQLGFLAGIERRSR